MRKNSQMGKTQKKAIKKVLQGLDDDKIGLFYCVYLDQDQYWGCLVKVCSMLYIIYINGN